MSEPLPRAAVLGAPITHSLSPVLHRAAYAAAGLAWDYTAIECDEAALPGVLSRVRSEPGWRGLSLTMPLKVAAMPLADELSDDVAVVGALNTLVVDAAGDATRLVGHNTDIAGVRLAVRETGVIEPQKPLVLGAGGTARAAVVAMARLGAPLVVVVARDVTRAASLAAVGERAGIDVRALPWTDVRRGMDAADVVIATTPKGATDSLCEGGWPAGVPLVDVLYDPWPTRLASYAAGQGAPIAGGMAVLAYQAAEQFELMTGRPAPTEAIRAAGEQALAARRAGR